MYLPVDELSTNHLFLIFLQCSYIMLKILDIKLFPCKSVKINDNFFKKHKHVFKFATNKDVFTNTLLLIKVYNFLGESSDLC